MVPGVKNPFIIWYLTWTHITFWLLGPDYMNVVFDYIQILSFLLCSKISFEMWFMVIFTPYISVHLTTIPLLLYKKNSKSIPLLTKSFLLITFFSIDWVLHVTKTNWFPVFIDCCNCKHACSAKNFENHFMAYMSQTIERARCCAKVTL